MSETDEYILECIRTWVWSGFYSGDEVQQRIDDVLEADADEDSLRAAVWLEFEKKAEAESGWPEVTDCDALDAVFEELEDAGIIALQNAGVTMSDGLSDVDAQLASRDRSAIRGYCFYHGQDLECAMADGGLRLAFGDLDDDPEQKLAIGRIVEAAFRKGGFEVDWNGDPQTRIYLPKIEWKRRLRDDT
jgi:hypothetical protein